MKAFVVTIEALHRAWLGRDTREVAANSRIEAEAIGYRLASAMFPTARGFLSYSVDASPADEGGLR